MKEKEGTQINKAELEEEPLLSMPEKQTATEYYEQLHTNSR